MALTPEQKQIVASWVAAGDNLSAIQKKLQDELKITMTYMDVRFLVDDLDLTLKDPAPKADATDVTKARAKADAAGAQGADPDLPEDLEDGAFADGSDGLADDATAPAGGSVRVEVDKVNLIPGAMASGSVTFSDGVTGKWIVDNYGRPGFTEVSQQGYRPSAADAQAFMQELSAALQKQGF